VGVDVDVYIDLGVDVGGGERGKGKQRNAVDA